MFRWKGSSMIIHYVVLSIIILFLSIKLLKGFGLYIGIYGTIDHVNFYGIFIKEGMMVFRKEVKTTYLISEVVHPKYVVLYDVTNNKKLDPMSILDFVKYYNQ